MRILIAGILGAIAMFVWTSIAHVATPLGHIGFSQIPNEVPVVEAMERAIGDHDGLYFFPWVDPSDSRAMQNYAEKTKNSASGFIIYHAPGASNDMMKPMIYEFAKELIEALIAAFLVGVAGSAGYAGRVGFVTLVGVTAAISTNASYWIWYKFPCDYTLAYMAITLIGYFVAALVIAAIVRTRQAPAA
ncbi:MAG TPA: hypothetical protein VLW75_10265 [Rhizomicrobium sp.]|nr:hypothetical protein [Rhizomicrobium sp.]